MDELGPHAPYARIATAVGLLLLATLALPILDLPARSVDLGAWGISRSLLLPAPWFLGAIMVLLTAVQSDGVIRMHPAAQGKGVGYAATFWPLPCIIALLSPPIVDSLGFPWNWAAALAGPFLLAAVLLAQYHALSSRSTQWLLSMLAYTACFGLYWGTSNMGLSQGLTAIVLGGVSILISIEVLRLGSQPTLRIIGYALIAGLILGQLAWGLLHWEISPFFLALVLFGLFYAVTGVQQANLDRGLTRAAALEHVAFALASLALFWYAVNKL
jgi:hypothetical protein